MKTRHSLAVAATVLVLALGLSLAHSAGAAPPKKSARTASASAATDSNAVLVRIGNEAITRRQIQARLNELPEQYRANYSTPEGRQQLLDRMIEERVWLIDANRNGVADRPAVKQQLEQQRRDLLIRTWINEIMAENAPPSDSEAQAYYNEHLADFKQPATIAARHIQLKSEADAKRVLLLTKAKGADWDKLALQWSADTLTKRNGGSLGTVTMEGRFASLGPEAQPALAEFARDLGDGKIGGPFKTSKGWHIVKLDKYNAETVRTFEQTQSFITRQLAQQKQQSFYQDRLAKVKARLGVKPDSAAIKGFVSQRKSAREMFADAQNAGAPDARIAAYRELIGLYPDADIAPQAQFMIGFIDSEELKNYDDAEKAFRELLARYPKSELAPSAQWMVEHMRSEDAPAFMNLEADSSSSKAPAPPRADAKGSTGKP